MIRTLIRVLWLGLLRDRIALGLAFVLPVLFFSMFAVIFGSMSVGGGGGVPGGDSEISVIAVDLDQSEISRDFLETLDAQDGIELKTERAVDDPADEAQARPFTRDEAVDLVFDSGNDFSVAVIVPAGFGESFGDFTGDRSRVEVIYDPANPVANYAVTGLVQAASFQTAPDILMERGMSQLDELDEFDAGLTAEQREAIAFLKPFLRGERSWGDLEGESTDQSGDSSDRAAGFQGVIEIESKSARQVVREERSEAGSSDGDDDESTDSMMPYYAAGIGVMFLLFSMVGAAGSMLKEAETGALGRVLSSNVTMTTLLASKWAFFTGVGALQLFIMFVWGALLFGLELWTVNHLTGFWIMTLVTAGAASAFGMMMATVCRTRGQLDGISTIVILIMSAVGGSMIPRIFMPKFMQSLSDFTFNGQALNGFLDVFWNERPGDTVIDVIARIAPSVGVLAVMGLGFFAISRLFARRWEWV